jgi:hypothetical protein
VHRAAFRGKLFDSYFTTQPQTRCDQRFADGDALKSEKDHLSYGDSHTDQPGNIAKTAAFRGKFIQVENERERRKPALGGPLQIYDSFELW